MRDALDDARPTLMTQWPIVLLRVYTGIFFLYFGAKKVMHDDFAAGMTRFLEGRLETSFAFYRPFIEAVALPNAELFAFLVTWGEVTIGIALILGLATRYAAGVGAFMVANFWFAKGQAALDAQNHDIIWLIILVVLAGLHAGRVLGLDRYLSTRLKFLT